MTRDGDYNLSSPNASYRKRAILKSYQTNK